MVVDINKNPIENPDLTKGKIINITEIKSTATPIDNITKFAYNDNDYYNLEMYIEYSPEELQMQYEERKASQLKQAIPVLLNTINDKIPSQEIVNLDLLFPDYQTGTRYNKGDIVKYKGQLWRIGKGTIN